MTDADIDKIERELAVTLPVVYRRLLLPFPIPALAGNTDLELWDDADRLIELNRDLRAGKWSKPWPVYLFALGYSHGDSIIAMDIRNPDAPAWWVDHFDWESKSSGQTHARFEDWAQEYLGYVRSDLVADGHNPEGSPAELDAAIKRESRRSLLFLFVVIPVASIVLLILGTVLWAWLRKRF